MSKILTKSKNLSHKNKIFDEVLAFETSCFVIADDTLPDVCYFFPPLNRSKIPTTFFYEFSNIDPVRAGHMYTRTVITISLTSISFCICWPEIDFRTKLWGWHSITLAVVSSTTTPSTFAFRSIGTRLFRVNQLPQRPLVASDSDDLQNWPLHFVPPQTGVGRNLEYEKICTCNVRVRR